MTFREKLELEHPEYISDTYTAGCYGCPKTHGYGPNSSLCRTGLDIEYTDEDDLCTLCWNREIPKSIKFIEKVR